MFRPRLMLLIFSLLLSFAVKSSSGVPFLTLKPLAEESNKGSIGIAPLKDAIGVVELKHINNVDLMYYVVKFVKRSSGGFHLISVDDKKTVISKGLKRTRVNGTDRSIFKVNLSYKNNIEVVAVKKEDNHIIDRFNKFEYPDRVNWKQAASSLRKKCAAKTDITWGKGLSAKLKRRSIHLLNTLINLCLTDKDYKGAISEIVAIKFSPLKSGPLKIKMSSNVMQVFLSSDPYVLAHSSRYSLLEIL